MIWHGNNKGKILVAVTTFPFIGILLFLLVYPDKAGSGPYLDSAHGSSAYGVNRSDTATIGYSKGNCAHCHEQHASIGGSEPAPAGGSPSEYAIFADNFTSQSDDFCLYCHKGAGSVQVSFSRTNYNYSYWFGGDTVNHATPNNIYDAFNPVSGSSHNLQDILTFVKTKWPATFKDESNPCNACHNPHLSKRGYPIVRPTNRNNIWGDSAGEHMSDFAASHGGQYQAPYWYPCSSPPCSQYEPDGSATTDGSNLPDYVTFCSDCHNKTNQIWSSTLGRNLNYIDWTEQNRGSPANTPPRYGNVHGSVYRCWGVDGYSGWGSLKEPYYTANYANFITCCTDCHEPHGSINGALYLLRKTVNGNFWNPWNYGRGLCESCHNYSGHGSCPSANCVGCHFHTAHSGCGGNPGASSCGTCPGPNCYLGHTF